MLSFLLKVVLISSSGALAPGPLTTATLAIGAKHGWRGGFKIAVGHMAVELPLVMLIGMGLYGFLTSQTFVMVSSILGGLFMLFFSYLTVKDALKANVEVKTNYEKYPLMVGIALSALNPFFILWWVTIGFTLVVEALNLWGYFGLIPLYASHVWLDFAWLILLAHITSLSGLSLRIYRAILLALGVAIGLFGLDFIHYGIFSEHLLPL